MKRVIGFALFFLALGIILAMVLSHPFIEVVCIILCIVAGYGLFCGK